MSTSKATLYDGALRVLGQPKLSSLTEARESRYLLDAIWDENARDNCLEMGNWNFATRTVKIEYDSSIDPDFGFSRAFTKPTDWIRTVQVSADEFFSMPLTDAQYADEVSNFFAEIDTLYLRFVSNDASFGYDLSVWPQSFIRYFEHYMAREIGPSLHIETTGLTELTKDRDDALIKALSKDALNEGIKFPPETSWTRARRGPRSRGDRGSRSRLTG